MDNRTIYKFLMSGIILFAFFAITGATFGRALADLLGGFSGAGRVRIMSETFQMARPSSSGTIGKLTEAGEYHCSELDGAVQRAFGLTGTDIQSVPVTRDAFESWRITQRMLVGRGTAGDFRYSLPEGFVPDSIEYPVDPQGLTIVARGSTPWQHTTVVVSWVLAKERICRFRLIQTSETDRTTQFNPVPALLEWREKVLAANGIKLDT